MFEKLTKMFSANREIEQEALFNMLSKSGTQENPIDVDAPTMPDRTPLQRLRSFNVAPGAPMAPHRTNTFDYYSDNEEDTVIMQNNMSPNIDVQRLLESVERRDLSPHDVADVLVHQGSDQRINQIQAIVENAMILMDSVMDLRRDIEQENSVARRIMFELIHHDTKEEEEDSDNNN